MEITNKEKELLNQIDKIKNKKLIPISEFEELIKKIGEYIQRKNQQVEEIRTSRDMWKSNFQKLQNGKKKRTERNN